MPVVGLKVPASLGTHGVLLLVDLYFPASHAVHVMPPSELPYPALQRPADVPPQPALFTSHTLQTVLPRVTLYLPVAHARQFIPLSDDPYPAAQMH